MASKKNNTIIPIPGTLSSDSSTLTALCLSYRLLQEKASNIEAEKKALMSEITPIAERLNIQSQIVAPGVRIRKASITYILKERLLEKGVTLDTIEYATKETEYYKVEKASEKSS